ncbi:MAG TPA: Lrp/AsnC family transcriptional regulator [Thermoplasmata archaeon]|nr:Lrp/AsnC family transcriptional regulator [Thermoplasmata archaeon]
MISAYILVRISATDPGEVVEKLRRIEGVKQAHVTAGPTDSIAFIEGPDLDALTASVLAIRAVEGVERTDTRLAVA